MLVTGAGGQDGHYLVEQLHARGDEVHALDRSDRISPSGAGYHRCNVEDVEQTRQIIDALRPDVIYNLAAVSSVAESWNDPDLVARVNGAAAVGLLESAFRIGARFVQASSAEIFGQPTTSPQDESTAIRPINPYGAAKAYAHLMVEVYRQRGLHASSLVLYNHESPRRPTTFVTRKITSTVVAIAQGRADGLLLGNLDARRDWGWAPDYVSALVAAADAESPSDYVIATGTSHSVADFAREAFAHVGIEDWRPLVSSDPRLGRPTDAAELVGNAARARAALGWEPTVGFTEIVARMVQAEVEGAEPTVGPPSS